MSEELQEIVTTYQKRLKQGIYFIIAFLGTNFLMVVLFFVLANVVYETVIDFGGLLVLFPAVFIGSLLVLSVTYIQRRDSAKRRVNSAFNEVMVEWTMQAIEETIVNIHSIDPVSLEKIEFYTQSIIKEKFASEFPKLILSKLYIVYPNIQQTLLQLLNHQPFLGTYYQVEQHFIKHFEEDKK